MSSGICCYSTARRTVPQQNRQTGHHQEEQNPDVLNRTAVGLTGTMAKESSSEVNAIIGAEGKDDAIQFRDRSSFKNTS